MNCIIWSFDLAQDHTEFIECMKKVFVVVNWKSNKTILQAEEWFRTMNSLPVTFNREEKEIIVCAPFTLLSKVRELAVNCKLSIAVGAQNVSPFDEGSYTGEVSAKQIKEFADFVIIGHSERRKYLHETEDDIVAKVKQLIENKITPILCISDMKQMDYYLSKGSIIIDRASNIIFVYEPPSAISTNGQFHAEDPEAINQNAGQISRKIGKKVITLYGGSVNPQNAGPISALSNIDGCLVGQASLDAQEFYKIIQNA